MINTCIYLTAFVFVLSLVVIVHEGGHFFVARLCGVKVTEFSIGFGKVLFSRSDKKGTLWKICLLPLGGYVKMLGDEEASSTKASTTVPEQDKKYMFANQSLWKRSLIIIAGPGMNYVFAIILLTGLLFTIGEVVIPSIVGEVIPDMPAAKAGVLKEDRIQKINGTSVESYSDIVRALNVSNYGQPIILSILRNNQPLEIKIGRLSQDPQEGRILLGIKSPQKTEVINSDLGLFGSFKRALEITWNTTTDTVVYLRQILFEKRSAKDMRGPLGIAEASGDALLGGLLSLLLFIINISIAIGFMNLLPIPVLDGGHLALYLVEFLRGGKPISLRLQNALLWTGMTLLLALVSFTFFLDIPRIIQRIIQ